MGQFPFHLQSCFFLGGEAVLWEGVKEELHQVRLLRHYLSIVSSLISKFWLSSFFFSVFLALLVPLVLSTASGDRDPCFVLFSQAGSWIHTVSHSWWGGDVPCIGVYILHDKGDPTSSLRSSLMFIGPQLFPPSHLVKESGGQRSEHSSHPAGLTGT